MNKRVLTAALAALFGLSVGMGAAEADIEMEVIEEQEFNMVRDFYTAGKNIRVKLQVKPGLISGYGTGGSR